MTVIQYAVKDIRPCSWKKYIVEVKSLRTLRLESLNSYFNHSTHFLLTNYSFGKSVRTSTLCMTQVIFPTIVYRLIVSLIIHCITIPLGQTFTYTISTVPFNSLENSRKWCHVSRSFWWANLRASFLLIFPWCQAISQDLRKNKCRPPQVWFILGSNFQTPEGTTLIYTNNSTQV